MNGSNRPDPIDSLCWLTARIWQLTAIDEPDLHELLEEARALVAKHTVVTAHYSDGTPVLTHYWLGEECVNTHLNSPPTTERYTNSDK